MQLLSLIIITLFIRFMYTFHHHRILTQDRRLNISQARTACDPNEYILWYNTIVPDNFPLPLSEDLSAYLYAPDCASRYATADTWFVSWANDDLLYSAFTDGMVDDTTSSSGATYPNSNTTTGHAIIMGSNPLNLTIISPGIFESNTGPYTGRYPSDGVDKAQPLFTFPNKTGTVTASYIPALEKYLMVISTATYPGVSSMVEEFDVYILESNHIEGPWSLVEYLNKFGPEAYFPIIPTKFIGQTHDIKVLSDGSSLWPFYLGYSANFACCKLDPNPPHS
ncbi:unnamed protein product, partial [Rotaria sp. Silwood1]